MFIRGRIVKDELYFAVIQGYRDEAGRVRHRTIVSLGRCEDVEGAIATATRKDRAMPASTETARGYRA
jgi:hypothetical protein